MDIDTYTLTHRHQHLLTYTQTSTLTRIHTAIDIYTHTGEGLQQALIEEM